MNHIEYLEKKFAKSRKKFQEDMRKSPLGTDIQKIRKAKGKIDDLVFSTKEDSNVS